MRVFKMRQKLHSQGLVLLPHGNGFTVTDEGVKHPFEKHFDNLQQVEQWWAERQQANNRLSEAEAEGWDEEWKQFVINQCDGCRLKLPVRDGYHYREDGTIYMGCEKERYEDEHNTL